MDFEATKKKWRVILELSNNKTTYDIITMVELTMFIGKERRKSHNIGTKIKPLTPVESWLLDIAFKRFKETSNSAKVISAEIKQLRK